MPSRNGPRWVELSPATGASRYDSRSMVLASSIFEIRTLLDAFPLILAGVLLLILVVSFRSRATVFCQYLESMTGIKLSPSDVKRVFAAKGKDGVRELFLDLIIREDLKAGPLQIPGGKKAPGGNKA